MKINIVLYALIASAGVYGAIAYWKFINIKSIKDLFHLEITNGSSNKETDGSISLIAANLTLGTGMVYIASLAQQQAIMAFLAPLGVLVGYLLLSRIVTLISMSANAESHNLLDSIKRERGGRIFFYFVSLMIVLTYLILIPFEIFVSSNLLSAMTPSESPEEMPRVFAYSLFFIVVFYSALGGLRGVVATDKLQFAIMSAMMLTVVVGAWALSDATSNSGSLKLLPDSEASSVFTLAAVSFITAISTQIYSILNLSMGTNFDTGKQCRVYRNTGYGLFVMLSLFAATGLATSMLGSSSFGSIDLLLLKFSELDGLISTILVFVVVLGMMAVLISTIDSGIIAIAQITHDNIFGLDSFSNEGGRRLLAVRLIFVAGLNATAAIPLIIIFSKQPNIIGLLLSSVSALTVAAPIIASAAVNISRHGKSIIGRLPIALSVLFLIMAAWLLSMYSTMYGNKELSNYIILTGVLLGLIFYFFDARLSSRTQDHA